MYVTCNFKGVQVVYMCTHVVPGHVPEVKIIFLLLNNNTTFFYFSWGPEDCACGRVQINPTSSYRVHWDPFHHLLHGPFSCCCCCCRCCCCWWWRWFVSGSTSGKSHLRLGHWVHRQSMRPLCHYHGPRHFPQHRVPQFFHCCLHHFSHGFLHGFFHSCSHRRCS